MIALYPLEDLHLPGRILAKMEPEPNGCVTWHGPRTGSGVPVVSIRGELSPVRRLVHAAVLDRPLGADEVVWQTCDGAACVAAHHGEVISVAEHMDRLQRARRRTA
jgi:hypothetical protein